MLEYRMATKGFRATRNVTSLGDLSTDGDEFSGGSSDEYEPDKTESSTDDQDDAESLSNTDTNDSSNDESESSGFENLQPMEIEINPSSNEHKIDLVKLEKIYGRWCTALSFGWGIRVMVCGSASLQMQAFVQHLRRAHPKLHVLTVEAWHYGLSGHKVTMELVENSTETFTVLVDCGGEIAGKEHLQKLLSLKNVRPLLLFGNINSHLLTQLWSGSRPWLDWTVVVEGGWAGRARRDRAAGHEESTLLAVARALTQNGRRTLRVLLQDRAQHKRHYEGMETSALYEICRKNMIATSMAGLRAHLTELTTHNMFVGGAGGTKLKLRIPAAAAARVLKEFEDDDF